MKVDLNKLDSLRNKTQITSSIRYFAESPSAKAVKASEPSLKGTFPRENIISEENSKLYQSGRSAIVSGGALRYKA